jgi:hypothetical protein
MNAINISDKFSRDDKITRSRARLIKKHAETPHAAAVELRDGIRERHDRLYSSRRVPIDQVRSELAAIARDVETIAKIAKHNRPEKKSTEWHRSWIIKRIDRLLVMDILPMWALRPQLSELWLDLNNLVACAWVYPG